jgi:uncharacterized membrane protein
MNKANAMREIRAGRTVVDEDGYHWKMVNGQRRFASKLSIKSGNPGFDRGLQEVHDATWNDCTRGPFTLLEGQHPVAYSKDDARELLQKGAVVKDEDDCLWRLVGGEMQINEPPFFDKDGFNKVDHGFLSGAWRTYTQGPFTIETPAPSLPAPDQKTEGLTKREAWKAMADGHTVEAQGLFCKSRFRYCDEKGLLVVIDQSEAEPNKEAWRCAKEPFQITITDDELVAELEGLASFSQPVDPKRLSALAARVRARKA